MAPLRLPRSVRGRTTVAATAAVALALLAVSWALLAVLESSLVRSRDDLSRARLADLVAEARRGAVPPTVTDVGEDGMGQVVAAGGRVVAASDGLTGSPSVVGEARNYRTPRLLLLHDVQDDGETEDYRAWARSVRTRDGVMTVVVGASPEAVQEATRALRTSLIVGAPVLLLAVAAGTRGVVGRSLRPVEDLRRELATLSEDDLTRRVPVPATGDEVARLAGTMNELLTRLEVAGARQREFVGDASHELRTPLTTLRAQLEVALAHPRITDWESLADELLDDVVAMELLVHDLLELARHDATGGRVDRTPVDLDEVVLAEVDRLRGRAWSTGRLVTVDASGVSAGPVRGDADQLARAARNLLENAAEHAGSVVEVRVASDGRIVTLAVDDDGPGIPQEQQDHVFERFTRLESDRARGGVDTARRTGTGLGLAIVRGVARRHGGEAVVGRSHLGGAAFVLRLPVAE